MSVEKQRFSGEERPSQVAPGRDIFVQKNPYEDGLTAQGFSFNVPKRFRDVSHIPVDITINSLTGLPLQEGNMLRAVSARLSRALLRDETWALGLSDADNLNAANNNIDHSFGNMVIQYGVATTTQAIEEARLRSTVDLYAMRGASADETLIWMFGITSEEIEKVREKLAKSEQIKHSTNPDFMFSTSTAVISSQDDRISDDLVKAKIWLQENPGMAENRFFAKIEDLANKDAREIKKAKDLKRITVTEFLQTPTIHTFVELMKKRFGNSRISDGLLEVIIKLSSAETIIALKESTAARAHFKVMLSELGLTEEQLRSAKTPKDIQALFIEIFGPSTFVE